MLQYPPNFALSPSLLLNDIREAVETCHTKVRYNAMDDNNDDSGTGHGDGDGDDVHGDPEDPELESKVREQVARSKVTYLCDENSINMNRKRVTDFSQNSKVYLPPPLDAISESVIAMRSSNLIHIFKRFTEANCDAKGRQELNLDPSEVKALKSLMRKVKEGEIVIAQTDKSGKFSAIKPETYLNLGEKHTCKCRNIQE